jgi:hypothetical protein
VASLNEFSIASILPPLKLPAIKMKNRHDLSQVLMTAQDYKGLTDRSHRCSPGAESLAKVRRKSLQVSHKLFMPISTSVNFGNHQMATSSINLQEHLNTVVP